MKYLERLNGTTKVLVSIVVLVAALYGFDTHYAKASDVAAIQQSTGTILDVLKIQYLTRKGVLELKKEQRTITPAESVELRGIITILATLEKRGQ